MHVQHASIIGVGCIIGAKFRVIVGVGAYAACAASGAAFGASEPYGDGAAFDCAGVGAAEPAPPYGAPDSAPASAPARFSTLQNYVV